MTKPVSTAPAKSMLAVMQVSGGGARGGGGGCSSPVRGFNEWRMDMGLSCSCSEWDGDGWYWVMARKTIAQGCGNIPIEEEYFFPLKSKRSKRCCSCNAKILPGQMSLRFNRWRAATEFEQDKLGWDEVKIAPWFMCESCGEIFLNLDALGYCLDISDHMPELLDEHREEHAQ